MVLIIIFGSTSTFTFITPSPTQLLGKEVAPRKNKQKTIVEFGNHPWTSSQASFNIFCSDHVTNHQSTINQLLVHHHSTIHQPSFHHQSTIKYLSVSHQLAIIEPLFNHHLTIFTDHFISQLTTSQPSFNHQSPWFNHHLTMNDYGCYTHSRLGSLILQDSICPVGTRIGEWRRNRCHHLPGARDEDRERHG